MSQPDASIWKQILAKLDRTNQLLQQLTPPEDIALKIGKRFDASSIDQQLVFRPESFGERLQRFKEGQGYSISDTDEIGGGTDTAAINTYIKLQLKNPENSPIVAVITEAIFTASVATRWVIESPVKPAGTSTGTTAFGRPKKAGQGESSLKIDYIASATEPSRPSGVSLGFGLTGKVVANSPERIPIGSVLLPNSSQLIDIFLPATTDTWHLGAEWFEIPLK